MTRPPFHLALPVHDLEAARAFYVDVIGCAVGRDSDRWIDFDFRGHQVTVHLVEQRPDAPDTNPVDGHDVPVRHFGAVLPWEEWHRFAESLKAQGQTFLIEPHIRFEGEVGEQATMFLTDPSGNGLEFKSFRDPGQLFARS